METLIKCFCEGIAAKRLSAAGYDLVKNHYTLDHTIYKMKKIYRELSLA